MIISRLLVGDLQASGVSLLFFNDASWDIFVLTLRVPSLRNEIGWLDLVVCALEVRLALVLVLSELVFDIRIRLVLVGSLIGMFLYLGHAPDLLVLLVCSYLRQ